ncbi:MAG: phosphopyruvate hydratase [Candidatus Curtissbacteria bacterium]
MSKVKKIVAREILDSRGQPTVEGIVELEDGSIGIYSVPSGASVGKHEAVELRDEDKSRFGGKGVLTALSNIASLLAPALIGMDAANQKEIDMQMLTADGTENKSKIGANSILALSGAIAKAQSASLKMPLYQYIAKIALENTRQFAIPTPMFNIVNGGLHAGGNLDFQEFLLVPPKAKTYSQNLRFGAEIYAALKQVLKAQNHQTLIGDEGGYAPQLYANLDVFKLFEEAITQAGYTTGLDAFFSLDIAASNIKQGGTYRIKDKPVPQTPSDLIEFYISVNEQYHLLSLEDPFSQDDWDDWTDLMQKLGGEMLIVGDDLTATNVKLLEKAIAQKAINAVIVKPNQIGTITQTLEFVKRAKEAKFKLVVSHRSGETNDDFIADFAVGVGADYVKFGAPARGERVAKYNRLLEIEHELS